VIRPRPGGIGAEVENLGLLGRTADARGGRQYRWSVLATGAAQIPLAGTATPI